MRINFAGILAAATLISIGCGGSGSSGTVPAPTAPSVPAAQPPAVSVGFMSQQGGWIGRASTDQNGSADNFTLSLQLTGAQLIGSIFSFSFAWGSDSLGRSGPFSGTVSGNTITFHFSFGNSGKGCGNAISGTATVSSVNTMTARPNTMDSMTATLQQKS